MLQSKLLGEVCTYLNSYKTSYSNNFLHSRDSSSIESNCVGYIVNFYHRNGLVIPKRACDIFDFIKESSNFLKLESLKELQPGDLILWRKNIVPESGDSGHICILKEKKLNGILQVYDFAKEAHDNDLGQRPGLGIGDIEILLTEELKPIGFKWLGKSKKTKFTEVLFARCCVIS